MQVTYEEKITLLPLSLFFCCSVSEINEANAGPWEIQSGYKICIDVLQALIESYIYFICIKVQKNAGFSVNFI